ncbi:MAG TPA: hypothetical protein VG247_00035 [Pseudonocardiaceae bacterium]|jgi:hypothetical protein|nr:hypothetical protein [Pseudonocardiaceae bacterium]
MAVDDLWYLRKRDPVTGERLKSKRHGRGKRWRVRWSDPETGEPRAELFERKADADRHDANMQADISRGQYIDPRAGKISIAEYAEGWRNQQLHRVATAARVESVLRLHIVPVLGPRRPLASIRSSHVQGWVKDRVATLSSVTVCTIYSGVLAPMFARAVIDKVIGVSPCVGIRLPEIADTEYVLPTADQVRLIADTVPERYRAVAFVAAGCGLRAPDG